MAKPANGLVVAVGEAGYDSTPILSGKGSEVNDRNDSIDNGGGGSCGDCDAADGAAFADRINFGFVRAAACEGPVNGSVKGTDSWDAIDICGWFTKNTNITQKASMLPKPRV